MKPLLAIVGDTWRQSKQQVVFIILMAMLGVSVASSIIIADTVDRADGGKDFSLIWYSDAVHVLESQWIDAYALHLMLQEGGTIPVMESQWEMDRVLKEPRQRARALTKDISPLQKSVEMWLVLAAKALFTLGMLGFIGASSGYFPGMLAAGSIDMILSKPIPRYQIFLGKYLGGLALFSALMVVCFAILYLGLGLRTGIWHVQVFAALPLMIFSAALLFALITFMGVLSRSMVLTVILGYAFYIVIDSILGQVFLVQSMGVFADIGWLNKTVETMRFVFPNFDELKNTATNSVLHLPHMDWTPVYTGLGWIVVTLGLGYLRFRQEDY